MSRSSSPRKLRQSTRRSREEPRGRTRRASLECLELRLVLNAADMRFVGQAFLDLLGRPADSAGLAYWTSQLDAGAPQSGIAQQLTHSAEYYGNEIIKPAYEMFLARDPDTSGLNFWVGQMQQGLTDEQLEAGFIGSPEFYSQAGGTDLTWVDAMYQDLLGRPADSGGQSYWVAQLTLGASRSGVAYGFAASLEREGQRIQSDYQDFLRRGAGSSEVEYWVGQFADGMTNESVIGGFIGSPEYFNFAQTSTDTQPPAIVDTAPADGAATNLGSQTVRIVSNLVDITLAADGSLAVGTLVLSSGATLEGSGTLTGNLTNGGSVGRAGVTQTGSIAVSGNYVQTAAGTLYLNLGGTAAGNQFDQLIVDGTATLAGMLSLELVNAFTPLAGDTFSIVVFPSSSGTFATVIGTDAGNGNSFVVDYEPADVKLSVT